MAAAESRAGDQIEPESLEQKGRGGAERRRFGWYLVVLAVLTAIILSGIGAVNYRLNPLVYDRAAIHRAAGHLAAGQNYTTYDTSINWRALRREQIAQWTTTPDVIVFGGSRWWEAHSDLVAGRTFQNLWVSNDQAEDALALTYLLERANRLPKVLVLSLRFISFQPPAEREFFEWQEWAPEYRAMADRLGVTPHSYATTAPVRQVSAMFHAPSAYDRVQQVSKVDGRPGVTSTTQQRQLETIASDGSIYWSEASKAKFTTQFVDKAVAKELKRIGNRAPKIDQGLVAAFERTLYYLADKGVQVVLAQTPYHPTFWNIIKQRPFGATLARLETVAQDMVDGQRIMAVGAYDPAKLGCVAANYIDHIHANSECIGKVLRLIPGLTTTTGV